MVPMSLGSASAGSSPSSLPADTANGSGGWSWHRSTPGLTASTTRSDRPTPGRASGGCRPPTTSGHGRRRTGPFAPDLGHFSAFQAKLGAFVGSLRGWSDDELRELTVLSLVLVGDRDFVRVEHAAHMQEVLPEASLAVVPGATHVSLFHEADLVLPILHRFLGD